MYRIMCNIAYLSIDISYDILDHVEGKIAIVLPLSVCMWCVFKCVCVYVCMFVCVCALLLGTLYGANMFPVPR